MKEKKKKEERQNKKDKKGKPSHSMLTPDWGFSPDLYIRLQRLLYERS